MESGMKVASKKVVKKKPAKKVAAKKPAKKVVAKKTATKKPTPKKLSKPTTAGSGVPQGNGEPVTWNFKLLSHHLLDGFGGMGEGMSIQTAPDGRRILWLAHESAPKNFTA